MIDKVWIIVDAVVTIVEYAALSSAIVIVLVGLGFVLRGGCRE